VSELIALLLLLLCDRVTQCGHFWMEFHPAIDEKCHQQTAKVHSFIGASVYPHTNAMAKRKNDSPANGTAKRRLLSEQEARDSFRDGLFKNQILEDYTQQYAKSEPYVIY